MKKMLIASLALTLAISTCAWSDETCSYGGGDEVFNTRMPIANRAWNENNIAALRGLDQATIKKFYEDFWNERDGFIEEEWGGSTWVDLAGDGKYELLVSRYNKAFKDLEIFWQEAPGKLRVQYYVGASIDPSKTVRDLNGDGRKELILMAKLDSDARTNSNSAPVAVWPHVCRLENGHYVEASSDFPKYYDDTVLPTLEKAISKMRQVVAEQQRRPKPTPGRQYSQQQVDALWSEPQRRLAACVMIRDKVLRVLGRDSNAGLSEAREWMKSPDPELVVDAIVVLRDMGGQPQDLAAAKSNLIHLDPAEADLQDFIDKQKP